MRLKLISILILLCTFVSAQTLQEKVSSWAKEYDRSDCNIKPSSLKSCTIDDENEAIRIVLGGGFQEQFFTPEVVENLYKQVKAMVADEQKHYELTIETDGKPIEDLVPNFFRKRRKDKTRMLNKTYDGKPWVKNISRSYSAPLGLEGKHISLWQSHGRYVKSSDNDWWWQRPRLFCTTEDLFSQTFVVPYIIPMLQNAGAVVFTPRERDWQRHEVVVDNDTPTKDGSYFETKRKKNGNLQWQSTGRDGFANKKEMYMSCDTPFCAGTARFAKATPFLSNEVVAHWMPNIPEEGKYAVYVSYQSFENSIEDAVYTVFHKGGMTEFKVNQKMGGGTWVYLGTFEFDEGANDYGMVELSNASQSNGIVTADAVRFGGGMGNVVPATYNDTIPVSGMPRWAEAAKYNLVWYGFPHSVHSETFGRDDYKNDIKARSLAVNMLSAGSIYNPDSIGKKVPLDMNIAFHTDAGYEPDDALVGSLSVYTTNHNNGLTSSGMDRYVNRDLSSTILTNLKTDLKKYNWQVRQLWNRDYGESRDPMTPCCILEMLSHQNFSDMKLGYDPNFKFDYARSVYKSIVKFIATIYQHNYTIQPLPVDNFAIELNEKKLSATLTWDEVEDPLEPTASPDAYIIYVKKGNLGFDNGTMVKGNSFTMPLQPDETYSFKITAVNEGGESFPSEVLAAGIASQNKGTVLIVNAFTRLEGPAIIDTQKEAGFDLDEDPGVPYGAFAGFCGRQKGWSRARGGTEGSDALGASGNELEGKIVMGNTFDYPTLHGNAIMSSSQHSFTSCSEKSVRTGKVNLKDYKYLDIIYGVQKSFDPNTNKDIENYVAQGGKAIISSANEGAPNIGGITNGKFKDKSLSSISGCGLDFCIYREMNEKSYSVPAPTILTPSAESIAIMTYADGSYAGIAKAKHYVRLGFPLESIVGVNNLNKLMVAFLKFLE